MRHGLLAFAFDQFEDRADPARRNDRPSDLCAPSSAMNLLDRRAFRAARPAWPRRRLAPFVFAARIAERQQFLLRLGIEQDSDRDSPREIRAVLFLVVEIMDRLFVAFAHFHQMVGQLAASWIALAPGKLSKSPPCRRTDSLSFASFSSDSRMSLSCAARELLVVRQILQPHFFRAELRSESCSAARRHRRIPRASCA